MKHFQFPFRTFFPAATRLVALTSEYVVKRIICTIWTDPGLFSICFQDIFPAAARLVAVTSEYIVKRIICTIWTGVLGHLQTVQTQIRRLRTRCLIRVCTVYLNYRKLRVK